MVVRNGSTKRVVYALPGLGKSTLVNNNPAITDFDVLADEIIGSHKAKDVNMYFSSISVEREFLTKCSHLISPMHFDRSVATSLAFVVPPRMYVARLKTSDRHDLIENFSEEKLFSWAVDAWSWSSRCKGRIVLGPHEHVSTYTDLVLSWFGEGGVKTAQISD